MILSAVLLPLFHVAPSGGQLCVGETGDCLARKSVGPVQLRAGRGQIALLQMDPEQRAMHFSEIGRHGESIS